jgi:hypothetical protein
MLRLLRAIPTVAIRFCGSRRDLPLVNLALRQQLAVLKQRHPQPQTVPAATEPPLKAPRRLLVSWLNASKLAHDESIIRLNCGSFRQKEERRNSFIKHELTEMIMIRNHLI